MGQHLPSTFAHFCFTDTVVATFCGRILQSRLPSNPAAPFQSGTGKLNPSALRDELLEEAVGKSSGGKNLIRLRCISALFVLRAVLGMPWDAPPALAASLLPEKKEKASEV